MAMLFFRNSVAILYNPVTNILVPVLFEDSDDNHIHIPFHLSEYFTI